MAAILLTRDVIQLRGDDVPFGIRALEAGITVEGVYVSTPSVTAHPSMSTLAGVDTKGSDRASFDSRISHSDRLVPKPATKGQPKRTEYSSPQPSPYLVLPSPKEIGMRTSTGSESSNSSLQSTNTSPSTVDSSPNNLNSLSDARLVDGGTSSAEKSPISQSPVVNSGQTSPILPPDAAAQQSQLPIIGSELFIQAPIIIANSFVPTDPSYTAATSPSEGPKEDAGYLEPGDDREVPGAPIRPHSIPLVGKRSYTFVRASEDLSLLQSHRLSHAAEVGQLTPRKQRIVSEIALGPTGNFQVLPVLENGLAWDIKVPPPAAKQDKPEQLRVPNPSLEHRPASDSPTRSVPHSRFIEDFTLQSPMPSLSPVEPVLVPPIEKDLKISLGRALVKEVPASPELGHRKLQKKKRAGPSMILLDGCCDEDYDLEAQR